MTPCNMTKGKLSPAKRKNLINVTLSAGGAKSQASLAFLSSCLQPFEISNATADIRLGAVQENISPVHQHLSRLQIRYETQ